jgi:hypothetical protein
MARYTYINDHSARDTVTGRTNWVVDIPVHYTHLRNNLLITEYDGDTLVFTPESRLADLRDTNVGDPEQSRRLVIEGRELENGHRYFVVVAIQAAEDSKEYIDCIVDQGN